MPDTLPFSGWPVSDVKAFGDTETAVKGSGPERVRPRGLPSARLCITRAQGTQEELLPTSHWVCFPGGSGHCGQASCQLTREAFHLGTGVCKPPFMGSERPAWFWGRVSRAGQPFSGSYMHPLSVLSPSPAPARLCLCQMKWNIGTH